MALMANYWVDHNHDITIITLNPQCDDWYKLHRLVRRVGLSLVSSSTQIGQAIGQNVRRVLSLRRAIRKAQPNIVISFLDTTNVLTLMAGWGLGIPIIVSERTDPRHHSIGKIWNKLRSLTYRRADAVVVQSSAVSHWASSFLRRSSVHVIPNPVGQVVSGAGHASSIQRRSHTVVAMGRLGREKGFDLLLEAFGRCAETHSGWSLVILGEGQERLNLEALAADLGITDRVNIAGQVHDPIAILRDADLFVLSSRYEGFPNALLEAMACGLAVISADCPSGPSDIIRNGVDGVLVPPNDVGALAVAMDCLMADQPKRKRLGGRAVEVVERFSKEKIMNIWEELMIHLCRRS